MSLTLADVRFAAVRALLAALPLALFAAIVAPEGDGGRWALAATALCAFGVVPTTLVERAFVGRSASPLQAALAAGLAGAVCVPVAAVQAWAIGAGWGTAWAPTELHGGALAASAALAVLGGCAFTGATYVYLDGRRHPPQPAPSVAERWLVRPVLFVAGLVLGVLLLMLYAWGDGLERRLVALEEPGSA